MNLLGAIDKLITEHGSAAVLDKHVALYKTQLEFIRRHVAELEADLTKVRAENIELEKYRSSHSKSVEFHEIAGACFRRLPNGGFEKTPRCPNCHNVLSTVKPHPRIPYECANQSCGYKIFFSDGLENVIAQLPNP